MANKENENVEVEVVTPDEPKNSKDAKPSKPAKKNSKKKSKGPNPVVTKTKETWSELKKVSWPSFGTVCKNTGIVITVVVVCTLVLFGIDKLLSMLYNLIPG